MYRIGYHLSFQSSTGGLKTYHPQIRDGAIVLALSINYFPSIVIKMITAPQSPKFAINTRAVFQDTGRGWVGGGH